MSWSGGPEKMKLRFTAAIWENESAKENPAMLGAASTSQCFDGRPIVHIEGDASAANHRLRVEDSYFAKPFNKSKQVETRSNR